MAQPSRYQYQPVTGPVWVAAVAATLVWLPAGNPQPLRTLLRPPPRDYTVAPVPFYQPTEFDWLPRGQQPARGLLAGRPEFVLGQPPAAAPFDPASLAWLPPEFRRPLRAPAGRLDLTVGVPFEALYRPAGLQWAPPEYRTVRLVPNRLGAIVLEPIFPSTPAYDPRGLQWLPPEFRRGLPLAAGRIDLTILGPFAPLYQPAGLQWLPPEFRRPLALAPNRLGLIVLEPILPPAQAYNPAGLQWIPLGDARARASQFPRLGFFVEPLRILLPYNPAALDWNVPLARLPVVRLRAAATGPTFLQPPATGGPLNESLELVDLGSCRYLLMEAGDGRFALVDLGDMRYALEADGTVRYDLLELGGPATDVET